MRTNLQLELIRAILAWEPVNASYMQGVKRDSDAHLAALNALGEQKNAITDDEWVDARKRWNILSSAAQYVSYASTLVIGTSALSVAPIAGGVCVAAAVAGLGQRVLSDSGIWRSDSGWATALGATAWLASLAGGMGVWAAGAALAAPNTLPQTIAIASTLTDAGGRLGKAHADKKIAGTQAQLHQLNSCHAATRYALESLLKGASQQLDTTKQLYETAEHVLRQGA